MLGTYFWAVSTSQTTVTTSWMHYSNTHRSTLGFTVFLKNWPPVTNMLLMLIVSGVIYGCSLARPTPAANRDWYSPKWGRPYWCRERWGSGSAGSPLHSGYRWFPWLRPYRGIDLLSGCTSSLLLRPDGSRTLWRKHKNISSTNLWIRLTKLEPLQNKYQLSHDYSESLAAPLLTLHIPSNNKSS